MNDRQTQFSSITTTGRTSPVRPNLPVRYSSRGSRTRSAGQLGEFNLALSNRDAARWLDIMRKNPQPGALDRCVTVAIPRRPRAGHVRLCCGPNRRGPPR